MTDTKKADQSSTNSELSSTASSTSYQPVPNTPTQKGKVKTPKYLRNASIKLLTHPVDKNIAWSFLLSVIFAAISVLTGFPTVIMLMWILGIALGLRIFFAGCCGYRRNIRVRDVEAVRDHNQRPSWLRPENFVRPPEALWLHDTSFNLHISHCLFFLDPGLTSSKLKDMVRTRVLNKTSHHGDRAFPRFVQKIVPVCSGYCWVDDEDFSVDNHIYDDQKDIQTTQHLEEYISSLMNEPLPMSRPLWEIRLIKNFGRCKDTILIVRIHQAVSDAITLIVILGNYLSDNQQYVRLKARFGAATFFLNLFRALFVAPLTFLGWLIFKPRDYNFFNRRHKPQSRVVAWSHNIRYSKVLRIKQVMRCSLNDVFVSAVSGAVRAYFTRNGIQNPPNVTILKDRGQVTREIANSVRAKMLDVISKLTLPVDLRPESSPSGASALPRMGCRFSPVHVRLPSNTEGAIPRLWDVRRRMEELKTSPDTVVMYGAIYCLLPILPEVVAQWIFNTVLRKATVVLANVPGPEEVLMLGSVQLKKITFWMSPRPEIPLVFSVISYAGTVQVSVSADRGVVPQPQLLVQDFANEISRLSHLLARRRIPGEHRRRSHFTEERRLIEILNPPDGELQQKLYATQEEIHRVTLQLSALAAVEVPPGTHRLTDGRLLQRLDELKEEFSELMRELRRRKSLADGIVLNNQDEDMDGELRRPRRLTLSSSNRRASLNTMLASTTRPLATPTIAHHSFVVSTPNLQAAGSPTFAQQKPSFLQVAQERFGRRKSDFN